MNGCTKEDDDQTFHKIVIGSPTKLPVKLTLFCALSLDTAGPTMLKGAFGISGDRSTYEHEQISRSVTFGKLVLVYK